VDELLLPFTRRKLGSSSNTNRYNATKTMHRGKTSANIRSTLKNRGTMGIALMILEIIITRDLETVLKILS